MDGFLRIGITREKIFPGEASMIESYLKDGTLDYVHIRKPEEDTDKVRRLISGIDPEAHCRLRHLSDTVMPYIRGAERYR